MRYIFYTDRNINNPLLDDDREEILRVKGIPMDELEAGIIIKIEESDYRVMDITKGVSKSPIVGEELNVLLEKI